MNKKRVRKHRNEKIWLGRSSTSSLHTKAFVFDRKKVFIGSLNLDPRSFYENTEIGLILKSQEGAKLIAKAFIKKIEHHVFRLELHTDAQGKEQILWHGFENKKPVIFDVEPYASFWQRLGVNIKSLLPIESQL